MPDEIEIADLAKAMAHPARIAILKLLANRNDCICGEIVDELPLSQSTISQHLKALKEAGLIKGNVDGPKVCYCLDLEACDNAKAFFSAIFKKINCC